jgi:hypothetical protein
MCYTAACVKFPSPGHRPQRWPIFFLSFLFLSCLFPSVPQFIPRFPISYHKVPTSPTGRPASPLLRSQTSLRVPGRIAYRPISGPYMRSVAPLGSPPAACDWASWGMVVSSRVIDFRPPCPAKQTVLKPTRGSAAVGKRNAAGRTYCLRSVGQLQVDGSSGRTLRRLV